MIRRTLTNLRKALIFRPMVPRELFAAILDRIQRFGVPPPLVQRG